ncbi:MAG: FAD-binding monooxygenase, partial [Nonomuraea sp.]|nr:FAD-binding monooxygenase [Nonomuraea sp.]
EGRAADTLLDTYDAERRPVALALADLTVRSQAARFGPNPGDDPLDHVLAILGQRYRSAAIDGPEHEEVFGDSVHQYARPGTRAPHLWLDRDGTRIGVHDLFHDAFVLLCGPDGDDWARAADKGVRVHQVGVDVLDVENVWSARYAGAAAVLVRPDGYVAWRASGPASPGELTRALAVATRAPGSA